MAGHVPETKELKRQAVNVTNTAQEGTKTRFIISCCSITGAFHKLLKINGATAILAVEHMRQMASMNQNITGASHTVREARLWIQQSEKPHQETGFVCSAKLQ